jgi:DNA-binding transcriptional ArsR family regulator
MHASHAESRKYIDICKYINYTLIQASEVDETMTVKNEKNSNVESCCDFKSLVSVFKALSDENRQKILLSLEEAGETSVGDLVEKFRLTQPTMSHHLGVLKNAGLVNDRREGQFIYYSINRNWLSECCRDYLSHFGPDE